MSARLFAMARIFDCACLIFACHLRIRRTQGRCWSFTYLLRRVRGEIAHAQFCMHDRFNMYVIVKLSLKGARFALIASSPPWQYRIRKTGKETSPAFPRNVHVSVLRTDSQRWCNSCLSMSSRNRVSLFLVSIATSRTVVPTSCSRLKSWKKRDIFTVKNKTGTRTDTRQYHYGARTNL